jgi:hypothetical protein
MKFNFLNIILLIFQDNDFKSWTRFSRYFGKLYIFNGHDRRNLFYLKRFVKKKKFKELDEHSLRAYPIDAE